MILKKKKRQKQKKAFNLCSPRLTGADRAIRIINNVPIRDHFTPHYVGLGIIKLPDIIKLSTCQLFYDHIVDKKYSNFAVSFVSEIHY